MKEAPMQRSFAAAVAAALFVICPQAFATAQRTFVSTAGNDANTAANCSLASPCRSFGGAITVTATDGEIIVLDSGGYGRVTIDKSVAIIAPAGVYAGISVFVGENGVDVDGAAIVVVLRGLTINGQGGNKGIAFAQGARLYIEQCTISNMAGRAVELLTGNTYITDTTIRDNVSIGIWAEGLVDLTIDRTRVERSANSGLRILNGPHVTMTNSVVAGNAGLGGFDIDTDNGSSQTVVTVTDSSVSQNGTQGFTVTSTNAGSIVRLAIARSTISRNGATGIFLTASTGTLTAVITDNTIVRNFGNGGIAATGAGVSATIAANAISGNGPNGVVQVFALLKTRANNIVQDNTLADVSGTLTFVSGD
jgi:hypothetical protein